MNNIDTSNRSSFFPNTASAKAKQAKNLNNAYPTRTDDARRNELEQMAKKDSKVQIPDAVKDFSVIKKAVDAAPEIDNSEKIAMLKAQIKSGTYKINHEAIADKMLSSEF